MEYSYVVQKVQIRIETGTRIKHVYEITSKMYGFLDKNDKFYRLAMLLLRLESSIRGYIILMALILAASISTLPS